MTTEDPAPEPAPEAATGDAAAPAEPAPETLFSEAQVRERMAAQEAQSQERLLRLAAEFDNYRRRTAKEREDWTRRALDAFVTDLLPVLDSFDRAVAAKATDAAAAASGLEVTERQFRAVLAKHGIAAVDPAGAPFDPRLHEAISREATSAAAPGTVLAVHEKGYTLDGRLLRAARVHVAAAPEGS